MTDTDRSLANDLAPPPAWQDEAPRKDPRVHVQREHHFQPVAIAFINRVMVQPYWVTAICHENELTDNQRARAKKRGVQKGVHDVYVCQRPRRSCWTELKWGNNQPSDAQIGVGNKLDECEIPRGFAWSIHDVLLRLREAAFDLHPNADNLAVEYQARAEAAVREAEIKAVAKKPRSLRVGKGRRGSPGQHVRIAKARGLLP